MNKIYLVILRKDWFVLRERETETVTGRGRKKERRRLLCFILGVKRERIVTSVRIATVVFGIFLDPVCVVIFKAIAIA